MVCCWFLVCVWLCALPARFCAVGARFLRFLRACWIILLVVYSKDVSVSFGLVIGWLFSSVLRGLFLRFGFWVCARALLLVRWFAFCAPAGLRAPPARCGSLLFIGSLVVVGWRCGWWFCAHWTLLIGSLVALPFSVCARVFAPCRSLVLWFSSLVLCLIPAWTFSSLSLYTLLLLMPYCVHTLIYISLLPTAAAAYGGMAWFIVGKA